MQHLENLYDQLDLVTGFLHVSNEKIYDYIKDTDTTGEGTTVAELHDYSFENYSQHINTSAFLLGFTHFENFLSKCLEQYFLKYPDLNEFRLTLKIVRDKKDDLIATIAELQSRKLPFSEKITFIERHLTEVDREGLKTISLYDSIRNCLMHNNGYADSKLTGKYPTGEKIILSTEDVNSFILKAREVAANIWKIVN